MRIPIIATLGLALIASAAAAHPTDIAFDTRGECEATYADASKFDRQRLVDAGIFDTYGAAQSTFRDLFRCEYDPDEDAWFIVFIGGPPAQPVQPTGG